MTNTPELRLNRLEAAWRAGDSAPDWRQHLPADEEPCSPQLIFDLLQMDIEHRIKAGLPALLSEHYFEHPRLQREDARLDDAQQVELIQWEYLQRLNHGERPRRAQYEAAFPRHREALQEMKARTRCPGCQKILLLEETFQTLLCPDCGIESQLLVAVPASVQGSTPVTELDLRGYQLIETLGKGGMGEVSRCCDPALGRDLAIKVMKAALCGHPDVERRFLREARITASLQHPNIVSVHNLGRLADGRLHYTMRLVRGQTFAAILKEEAGKAERLPFLLSIFEKICQAVAYAHSKRVIHRDLKPHNVMVGRFGEVQVMDWGLAKVLTPDEAASEPEEWTAATGTRILTVVDTSVDLTRQGSGFGTPAYMPPEQALGEWETVDERADVFALGSILCEILTGQPAYSGADGNEVYRRAKRGDLTEALQRLQQRGADAALIALCRECLSPERESRPRDAEAVAKRVAKYQAEVQERLRQAELERIAAETRTQEERKGRRRAIAFLLILLTVAVLGVWQAVRATFAESTALEHEGRALELARTNENLAIDKANLAEKERNARLTAEDEARKARTVATFLEGIFEASDPMGLTSNSFILSGFVAKLPRTSSWRSWAPP
jgi:serine/threonine protein kinase